MGVGQGLPDAGELLEVGQGVPFDPATHDPQALALAYVSDASKVDTEAQPRFEAGQACGNCALFMAAEGAVAATILALSWEALWAEGDEPKRLPARPTSWPRS